MKTIGYVSISDPFTDKEAWSGTTYKLRESIERAGYKVIWIHYKPSKIIVWIISHILRLFNKKSIQYGVYPAYLKSCAKSIDFSLVAQCDILFFPGMASIMKYVKTDKPFIYYSDATVKDMLDYYWFDVKPFTRYFAHKQERWAIQHCIAKISASTWAANTAKDYYSCDEQKNYVLLLGANLDDKDIIRSQPNNLKNLNILFSGVEWERKGAEIAIDAVKELNRRGIDAKLIMCGIKEVPSSYGKLPDCVEFLGFLNKNKPEEYKKYNDSILRSNIFLLPTKAECAGVVFCEASARGIPIFTYDTGGIPDYVVNGINGYRLPLSSSGLHFADKIEECLINQELSNLAVSSIMYYNEKLNWTAWSKGFRDIIENLMQK